MRQHSVGNSIDSERPLFVAVQVDCAQDMEDFV